LPTTDTRPASLSMLQLGSAAKVTVNVGAVIVSVSTQHAEDRFLLDLNRRLAGGVKDDMPSTSAHQESSAAD
jgi:hypothetical protein